MAMEPNQASPMSKMLSTPWPFWTRLCTQTRTRLCTQIDQKLAQYR